jgi:copper chaperone NosL
MKASSAWFLCLFVLAAFCTPSFAFEDISAHPACAICGMDRDAFGHSRMLVEFDDGRTFGTCSLRCAALVLQGEEGKKARSVKAADYRTRELVDAEKATWVIGGRKPGVMTRVPKWAFRDGEDAERFIAESGGARSTYEEALREALKELR